MSKLVGLAFVEIENCVGNLAYPFVKWMVVLLIPSFFLQLQVFTDEGVQIISRISRHPAKASRSLDEAAIFEERVLSSLRDLT